MKKRYVDRKNPRPKAVLKKEQLFTGQTLNITICVLLAAATIAVYSPAISNSFLAWDDQDYVTANPHIHAGLAWSTVKWAFTATDAANWHPLTWLSHALDYQLFGLNPAGHHLDSVLIHALNVVLLFLLLQWVTKRIGPSFFVAALFALHPVNVESVAWVAERKNVLSTMFFFLTIGAHVFYSKRPDWRRYLLVAALFAAGLMAKPMVITLPFVLLLLDYWPLKRIQPDKATDTVSNKLSSGFDMTASNVSKLLLEKVPLLFLSALSSWITVKAQHTAVRNFEEFPFAIRIENALLSYGLYLWKMLWPARLAFYPHPVSALPQWQWILSVLMLLAITSLVIVFRNRRYLPVGWFWFLGTLIPVIGLVQVGEAAMADRYSYIPLIGIFIMIAWGLSDLAEAKKIPTTWQMTPAFCILAALSCVTFRQIGYWQSDYDLWAHSLKVSDDAFAHNAMGAALMNPSLEMTPQDLESFDTDQKRMDEARHHFERALELRKQMAQQDPYRYLPYLGGSFNNLGTVDRQENHLDEARTDFDSALTIYRQLAPRNPDRFLYYLATTLTNLGALDRLQNRPDDARRHYEEALQSYRQLAERNPDTYLADLATMLNNLGNLNGIQNRLDDARGNYEEALKAYSQLRQNNRGSYQLETATALNNLGTLNLMQNNPRDARQHFSQALDIRRELAREDPQKYLPSVAATLSTLALLDRNENRLEESRASYQEALNIFRTLSQQDNRYAGDVTRVETSLNALGQNVPAP